MTLAVEAEGLVKRFVFAPLAVRRYRRIG